MTIEALRNNLNHMKEIVREMYVFRNQLEAIESIERDSNFVLDSKEKRLLKEALYSLEVQLKILNNSIPELMNSIGLYKKLTSDEKAEVKDVGKNLVQVRFSPTESREKISLIISDNEKKDFLENLSKSNLSINQLKKRYSIEKTDITFAKPNGYAIFANKLFRNFSNDLVSKGYFQKLNKNLRKMNSTFLIATYVSMILLTVLISFILSLIIFIFLVFFDVSMTFPFISFGKGVLLMRLVKFIWVIIVLPLLTGLIMYIAPGSEGKNLGGKIDQELPFVTIHMSAIATSGIEPVTIFKIILKSEEYKYTNMEFRKLMNLINFQGKDLVTALKLTSKTSPSEKLKELLDGIATSVTSGGSLTQFLNKHAENLLFDYKLDREKYTKTSETFMDIYISIVIAAPMILLMLFVIMGSTGTLGAFMGLSVAVVNLLIILIIIFLNVAFLVFLKLKQPVM